MDDSMNIEVILYEITTKVNSGSFLSRRLDLCRNASECVDRQWLPKTFGNICKPPQFLSRKSVADGASISFSASRSPIFY